MKGCGGLVMRKLSWGDPGKAPWKRCRLSWEVELGPKEKQGKGVYFRQGDSSHLVQSQGNCKIPNIHGELCAALTLL